MDHPYLSYLFLTTSMILVATVQTSASISSLTGSTQALSIRAEDSCGKSTTSTLSIVIKNQVYMVQVKMLIN
jgi:hypothetical protein